MLSKSHGTIIPLRKFNDTVFIGITKIKHKIINEDLKGKTVTLVPVRLLSAVFVTWCHENKATFALQSLGVQCMTF